MQYIRTNQIVKISSFLITFGFSACGNLGNFDFDLRGNEYDTSDAVRKAMQTRPLPDSRGIISYPTYEVAVARQGDTIKNISDRLGLDSKSVARYNGMSSRETLNEGQLISLPNRVSSQTKKENPTTPSRNKVNVTELASTAIEEASDLKKVTKKSNPKLENEPIRHKVSRGETAFTISRLYNVSIRSLAEWNGLDSNFTIREGQYLLIPLPKDQVASVSESASPGQVSNTPSPPSSSEALPDPVIKETSELETDQTKIIETNNEGRFAYPVNGKIIRDYVKNKTDGIDISAPEGSPVVAAETGVVAAITADTQGVPIIVLKHEGNLLTVYAGLGNISVKEKEKVSRSQIIGNIRSGDPSFLHFEVRRGFESIDPMEFFK
ncbi:MAG: LysM peptidoglycan-binding domain-containing protein [Rhodobacterales bacterium]|nr:LysM peptidoglycan-binding domain-containing protein [Rhodobacterales bacterium]